MDLYKKQVCVVGLGRSGLAAAQLLSKIGAQVTVSESRPSKEIKKSANQLPKNVTVKSGSNKALLDNYDLVIVSPGVPWDLPELIQMRKNKFPIWSELEFGYNFLVTNQKSPRYIVAVTGTNGKTTTTFLLGTIFKNANFPAVIAGNTGTPLCSVVDKITPRSVLVLEVSSYQLEGTYNFNPNAGIVLNITPDHLARHKTMDNYAKIKFKLFQNQDKNEWAILNADDKFCRKYAKNCKSKIFWFGFKKTNYKNRVFFDGKNIILDMPSQHLELPIPNKIIGMHNIENAMASAASALALGIPVSAIIKTFKQFPGVEHRLEPVRNLNGVEYINDSKATNVSSTEVALKSIQKPIYLIMGGRDKGNPYVPLIPLVRKSVKALLLIGESAKKIEKELRGATKIFFCKTLTNAVSYAHSVAKSGDIVLLSPACASFDQFNDFEHRGKVFKKLVKNLK